MLHLSHITKFFGDYCALEDITLELSPGEIHGLAGLNGSGKSTLLNILFGHPVIRRSGGFQGTIFFNRKKTMFPTPRAAVSAGIGMISQDAVLLPGMSVAENIFLGREPIHPLTGRLLGTHLALTHQARAVHGAGLTLKGLKLDMDPRTRVRSLPLHSRQFVEIAREAVRPDLKLLLLDEPTALLNTTTAAELLEVLRRFAQNGTTLLFVSHRLEEIMTFCRRVTILKNGRVAGRFDQADYDRDQMITCMTGRTVVPARTTVPRAATAPVLRLENFGVKMPGEEISDISLEVRAGEILGLAGLGGHGKTAPAAGVMGLYPTSGSVFWKDEKLDNRTPLEMIKRGLCLIPEDRRQMGILPEHSVRDNIVFTAMHHQNRFLRSFPIASLAFLNRKAAAEHAQRCLEQFQIQCRSIHQKTGELSGGNQQKVCIAAAFTLLPELLFINEPTRGVDIAAKEVLLEILLRINAEKGTTFVIASSELEELRRVCDRIAIFYEGSLTAVLTPRQPEGDFTRAMVGMTI